VRALRRIVPLIALVSASCAAAGPSATRSDRLPSDPLYGDEHILELAWQLRDMSLQAMAEAETHRERETPAFEPLGFETSQGLWLSYRVTPGASLDRHCLRVSRAGEALGRDAALNLLHFAADLIGVVVEEVVEETGGGFRLEFDLDAKGRAAVVENARTPLEEREILRMWRLAVLGQASSSPLRVRGEGG
jgi:hypothetical protein